MENEVKEPLSASAQELLDLHSLCKRKDRRLIILAVLGAASIVSFWISFAMYLIVALKPESLFLEGIIGLVVGGFSGSGMKLSHKLFANSIYWPALWRMVKPLNELLLTEEKYLFAHWHLQEVNLDYWNTVNRFDLFLKP